MQLEAAFGAVVDDLFFEQAIRHRLVIIQNREAVVVVKSSF